MPADVAQRGDTMIASILPLPTLHFVFTEFSLMGNKAALLDMVMI
jgi:hypothetical protein